MATVTISTYQLKSGKYSYAVYFKDPFTGKKKYLKSFRKKQEAQKAAAKVRESIDLNKFDFLKEVSQKQKPTSFNEVSDQLSADWQDKVDGLEMTEKTRSDYMNHLRKLINHFGQKKVSEITENDIKAFRKKTLDKGSVFLWNRRLFVLKKVFQKAVDSGAVLKSPCADMNYISEKRLQRCRYIMPNQIDELLAACRQIRNAKNYLPAIVLLAIEHGASKQEILDLRWRDIDFENNTITFFRTKNNQRRTRSIMPRTREALLHWRQQQELMRHKKKLPLKPDPDWVFSHHDGSQIREFRTAWNRACDLAGLEDYHFHDNRHTFCTNLIYAGANMKQVNVMVGHTDLRMTHRYTHVSSDMEDTLSDKLASRYSRDDTYASGQGKK
jgi:integrase